MLLNMAAFLGDVESIDSFIKKGTNLNQADEKGITPLMSATVSGKKIILLSTNRFHVLKFQSSSKITIYFLQIRFTDHIKIAEMLIKNGANINLADKKGRTPLYLAIVKGKF